MSDEAKQLLMRFSRYVASGNRGQLTFTEEECWQLAREVPVMLQLAEVGEAWRDSEYQKLAVSALPPMLVGNGFIEIDGVRFPMPTEGVDG
jgi:hypothetical protein